MINLAIIGSRDFNNNKLFSSKLNEWIETYGTPDKIISGGAKGADSLAAEYAIENNIDLIVHHANWKEHGKAAGPMRNTLIIDDCTHVCAFPSRKGRGTQDSLKKADTTGKDITIHFID